MACVYVKTYPAPVLNVSEVLRYAGWLGNVSEADTDGIFDCFAECEKRLSYRVCYVVTEVAELGSVLGVSSEPWFKKRFTGAKKAVLFCATVGLEIDRWIQRYARVSPTKALWFQALGAERVESLCNAFFEDLKEEFAPLYVGTRFSPGYGEIPLVIQSRVLEILDASRKIGVSVNGGGLMSPSKTVTAFVAIKETDEKESEGCAVCDKQDCALRKE